MKSSLGLFIMPVLVLTVAVLGIGTTDSQSWTTQSSGTVPEITETTPPRQQRSMSRSNNMDSINLEKDRPESHNRNPATTRSLPSGSPRPDYVQPPQPVFRSSVLINSSSKEPSVFLESHSASLRSRSQKQRDRLKERYPSAMMNTPSASQKGPLFEDRFDLDKLNKSPTITGSGRSVSAERYPPGYAAPKPTTNLAGRQPQSERKLTRISTCSHDYYNPDHKPKTPSHEFNRQRKPKKASRDYYKSVDESSSSSLSSFFKCFSSPRCSSPK